MLRLARFTLEFIFHGEFLSEVEMDNYEAEKEVRVEK